MRDEIGEYKSSINKLKLEQRYLEYNTLIIAEEGSGKTNLACKIRNYVIDNNVPTLYLDFEDSNEDEIELRYKDEHFNYIKFEESDEFDKAFDELVAQRKHIYMAINPNYFTFKRDVKSKLSKTIQKQEVLDNYYYFLHDITELNAFYTKFEDFLLYMFGLLNLKKYGMTFLAQPHEIFENPQLKLLFTFLYLGKCSNLDYYNTAILKNLPKNEFVYQYRTAHQTLLFNNIVSNLIKIDEYQLDT